MAERLHRPHVAESTLLPSYVSSILGADAKNYQSPIQFIKRNVHFFQPLRNPLSRYQPLSLNIPLSYLRTIASALSLVPAQHWTANTSKQNIVALAAPEDIDLKAWNKEKYHFLRWALAGGAEGPGVPQTMEILGRDVSVRRLSDAIRVLYDQEQEAVMAQTRPEIKLARPEMQAS